MTTPIIKASFSSGELSPSLYGRLDLQKWHSGCSVARNFFVSYKGGLLSRGGLSFVGYCKQPASANSVPPRNIEFTFSIFQSYILEFGDQYMRVIANGGYVTEAAFNVTGATQANPCVITVVGNNFSVGDDIFLANIAGMIQINAQSFRVRAVSGNLVTLGDVFGNPINSLTFSAYTGGGTAARVYTLTTPYAAVDLPYLKFTQSADVMSLTCVNQQTQTDYPPQELTRHAANNWSIAPPNFASSVGPPTGCAVTGTSYVSGAGPAAYGYVVTAVDAVTGEESVASNIGTVTGVVDISGQFGTNTVTWTAPTPSQAPNGVSQYNIYRAAADYTNTGNFTNQLFGYVGSTQGALKWQDTNIIADFATTPPLHIDPFTSSGNYPGVVAYFQQRRAYGYTINAPDTYEMSQPGAYTNFDSASPPIDSDAITGTPWAEQINGIQAMLPMPGGLVTFTGKTTWQVAGTSGTGSPITPSQQSATAQESVGCSAVLPPLRVRYNILFGGALNSVVYEINYNFYFNIYTGQDVTVLSGHLFQGYEIEQWGWAFDPYRVLWAVRSDGKLLSFTYVQEQEVRGWTRHDTNGQFASVAVASEPPVNAPYFVVKRYVTGQHQWVYMQERMDNRLWQSVEQSMCVDSALSYPQPAPNANLTASAAQGEGGVKLNAIILGGANYAAPAFAVIDQKGFGNGATVTNYTLNGSGAITSLTISSGQDYVQPVMRITDSTGSGAVVSLVVDNSVTFTADAPIFDGVNTGAVGQVLRMGGGIGAVSQFISATQIVAQMPPQSAITAIVPDDPSNTPLPAAAGDWTLTTPVSTVTGLPHLEGMTVNGLCDGFPVTGLVVSGGQVALPNPASSIVLGLPFIAQAQSMHADMPGELIQGKRKRVQAVTVRVANSRGVLVGQDQPIAAQQPNQAEPPWNVNNVTLPMTPFTEMQALAGAGNALPLFSGDKYVTLAGDYNTPNGQASPGMVGVMQELPLPCELLAFIPELDAGDTNG